MIEYEVQVFLPPTEQWYLFQTKKAIQNRYFDKHQFFFKDEQIGIFVRGGSILPITHLPYAPFNPETDLTKFSKRKR